MDANFGLEPWEVEKGFILACQAHPVSETLTLDYDKV
jgi:ring-1,2-phenylacetyl-CoA epoxidase subunit PaaE